MSVRLEWTEARYAHPTVARRGDRLADGGVVRHQAALVVGAEVVEGDILDLVGLCVGALELLVPGAEEALAEVVRRAAPVPAETTAGAAENRMGRP